MEGAKPLAILLVEDDRADARLVELALRPHRSRCRIHHCISLAEAQEWLGANPCDVVLLDLSLPDSFGFDTIHRVHDAAPHLAVIVLTGLDDDEVAVRAVAAGTQDYLVKGNIDGALMWRSIQYAVARKRLDEELRLAKERLQAIIDLAHDAIIVTDDDQRITLFNPAAEATFGYRSDEILGQSLDLLLPAPVRARHQALVRDFSTAQERRRGSESRRELVARRKDGSEFPAEIAISRADHPEGRLYTAVLRDISERKRTEEELRRLATTDPLTGVANRRHFLEVAAGELTRHRRYRRPAALLMLDIDFFKVINDGLGHAAGDAVLVRFAEVCHEGLRQNDLIGRLGGEEFAILLPETDVNGALEVAERLRHSLAATPVSVGSGVARFTVSVGVAACHPDDDSIEATLVRADRALYAAKHGGRNRVCAAGPAALDALADPEMA